MEKIRELIMQIKREIEGMPECEHLNYGEESQFYMDSGYIHLRGADTVNGSPRLEFMMYRDGTISIISREFVCTEEECIQALEAKLVAIRAFIQSEGDKITEQNREREIAEYKRLKEKYGN